METLNFFEELFANANPIFVLAVVSATLVLWFLPAILAYFFNRKHAKIIAAACVPAGLSLIAWCGLMIWAVTGKGIENFRKQKEKSVTEAA